MKTKCFHTLIITLAFLLTVSLTASSIIFARIESTDEADSKVSDRATLFAEGSSNASFIAMKVCIEKMSYYRNETLSGSAFTKKFGDIVYVHSSELKRDTVCIYTYSMGSYVALGYCKAYALVKADSLLFAEIPEEYNSDGQVSKLIDLRKYIRIFDAKVICDESAPVLVQYDVAMRLFEVAEEIYGNHGYTIYVSRAYIPQSSLPSEEDACCTVCSHSTGACLTLMLLAEDSETPIPIPTFDILIPDTGNENENGNGNENEGGTENEGENITPGTDNESNENIFALENDTEEESLPGEDPDLGENPPTEEIIPGIIAGLLEDYSFIREGEGDCFYDADHDAYISSDLDMSSLIYSIWE